MKQLLIFGLLVILPLYHALYAQGDGYGVTDGGNAGATVTVDNATDFATYAGSSTPYIIKIEGTINVGSGVTVASNKTIMGVDENSTVIGALNIKNGTNNVIVKYLNITNPAGDGITIREAT